MSATGATTPLGLAIAGPVGDALGVSLWFLLSGIVTTTMGLGSFLVPVVMRIEDRAGEEATSANG